MKYKSIFVIAVLFLFCLSEPDGFNFTNIYGDHSRGNHDDHGDRGNHGIRGAVSSVLGTTVSILGMDIDASVAEVVVKDCDAFLSINDIKEGDIIEVKGKIQDSTFVASIIKIEGAGKLEGTLESVGNDSITLLGKEIDIASAKCIKGNLTVGRKVRVSVRNSDTGLTALVVHTTRMTGH
ncbi:conserved hypothetical protein [Candidatus Brocadia pituitae]|nr:conserved hypothetical protein [Candidatus Brocadia pituitae]